MQCRWTAIFKTCYAATVGRFYVGHWVWSAQGTWFSSLACFRFLQRVLLKWWFWDVGFDVSEERAHLNLSTPMSLVQVLSPVPLVAILETFLSAQILQHSLEPNSFTINMEALRLSETPLLHTHSFIYHTRCIMFFSQYFSFPLSSFPAP
jgi:hypothetical protein